MYISPIDETFRAHVGIDTSTLQHPNICLQMQRQNGESSAATVRACGKALVVQVVSPCATWCASDYQKKKKTPNQQWKRNVILLSRKHGKILLRSAETVRQQKGVVESHLKSYFYGQPRTKIHVGKAHAFCYPKVERTRSGPQLLGPTGKGEGGNRNQKHKF